MCLVYARLNELIIVGIIQQPTVDFLEGTLVEYPSGEFGPRSITIPEGFLHHFNTRANQIAEYLASLSDKQWAAIGKTYEQDIDRLRDSDIYIATGADLALSGPEAFNILKASGGTKKKSE